MQMTRDGKTVGADDIRTPEERLVAAELLLEAYPDDVAFAKKFGRPRSELVQEVWMLRGELKGEVITITDPTERLVPVLGEEDPIETFTRSLNRGSYGRERGVTIDRLAQAVRQVRS